MLQQAAWFFPLGGGPAAQALQGIDWARHPLGPPQHWPTALKLALATMLRAEYPGLLAWDRAMYLFANDAALAAGAELREALAAVRPAREVLPCAWRPEQGAEGTHQYGAARCDWRGMEVAIDQAALPQAAKGETPGWTPLFDEHGSVRGGIILGPAARFAGALHAEVAQVIERMTDSFFMLDRNWNIVACNSQHERLTKMTRAQQVGRHFPSIFLAEKNSYNAVYEKHYRHTMQTRQPVSFLAFYPPLQLWTECHVHPTDQGGIAVFCRDVTAEHRATQALANEKHKFESIYSTSPTAMAVLRGHDLVFEHANARYLTLIGNRPAVGRRFVDVFYELLATPYVQLMQHVIATGEPYLAVERRLELIMVPGGEPEECYLDFAYTRIDNPDGSFYGVNIHANDVSERVRARLQLVEALGARDELLSICSHELKTPIASMKLSTQMFKRGLQRGDPRATSLERVTRMVDQSDRQLDRLSRLIEEMLDFSRINGGKLRLQPVPCNLSTIVTDTLERLRLQMEAASVAATVDLPDDASGTWDVLRLEQLFTNLVTNAIKYGAGGPIHVTVTRQGDEGVQLSVRDHGPGISEIDQKRIFLPYERAVSVHNISGLGLGLYISRQIAEAHGGHISVESTPGDGATFVVDLPRYTPAEPTFSGAQ